MHGVEYSDRALVQTSQQDIRKRESWAEGLQRDRASLLEGDIQKDLRRKDVIRATRGWRE